MSIYECILMVPNDAIIVRIRFDKKIVAVWHLVSIIRIGLYVKFGSDIKMA